MCSKQYFQDDRAHMENGKKEENKVKQNKIK